MLTYITTHRVQHGGKTYLPDSYITVTGQDEKDLAAAGALRKLTDTEALVYKQINKTEGTSSAEPAVAVPSVSQSPVPEGVEQNPSADDLETMTVVDLKKIAETEQIDLGAAVKKADIINAIRAARTDSAPPEPQGGDDDEEL